MIGAGEISAVRNAGADDSCNGSSEGKGSSASAGWRSTTAGAACFGWAVKASWSASPAATDALWRPALRWLNAQIPPTATI